MDIAVPPRLTLPRCAAALAFAAEAVFVSSASAPGSALAASPARPKLLVFLVVDGLPMRQVTDYRAQLAPDGFARFLNRGAWFAEAHYGHAYTVTAAGHAAMLTGAYPHRSGIIGNEWRDVETGERTYCTADITATYIGHKTEKLDGTSPKNLRVETVGDVLRRADPRSKVIGISGKDRGAILPAGKTGTAYMYMSQSGGFASSTFYMPQHPAWVETFNAAKPADRYFRLEWKPLLPDSGYGTSLPDKQPWFREGGQLPMLMAGATTDDKPTPQFYAALLRSPYVDEMSLAFGQAAIAGEQLGRDEAPDILAISLSGHDYVNHAYSAESRLSHDHLLQLDRQLQAFFRHLDTTVGKDNYVAVLTADHGFMPNVEHSKGQGLDAGRVDMTQALGRINAELDKRFGAPKLVAFVSASSLVLDRKLLAQKALDADAVAEAARNLLLAEAGVAVAYTRRELAAKSRSGQPHFDAMTKAWNRELSGDVAYALKPYWMSGNGVATHGSPHRYDTHVPILMYGPPWIKAGRIDTRVEVVDIAPTLARLLGVAVPSASEGKLLPLPR